MNLPYIDIHTHKICNGEIVCVTNVFPNELRSGSSASGFFSCGIHPWYIKNDTDLEVQLQLIKNEISLDNFMALGEAGLDKLCDTPWELQQVAFKKQITISENFQKPMIIHCVKAWDDILHFRKTEKPKNVWIIHGFNSSEQMAGQLIDSGCMLSFGSLIQRSDSKAAKVLSVLNQKDFFLETDDADINIEKIYKKASEIRNEETEKLKAQQYNNFERIFGKLSQ
ncbi:MAG: TatD family hydrolase [Bacteroidales bacterium]